MLSYPWFVLNKYINANNTKFHNYKIKMYTAELFKGFYRTYYYTYIERYANAINEKYYITFTSHRV